MYYRTQESQSKKASPTSLALVPCGIYRVVRQMDWVGPNYCNKFIVKACNYICISLSTFDIISEDVVSDLYVEQVEDVRLIHEVKY